MAQKNILVIEDDEDIQKLIRHNLEKDGFRVLVSETAEEGIRKLSVCSFDCILLDLMLPDTDGLEVCRKVKKDIRTQHIPIIMVTAKGEESDIVTGLELGADDYIVKPFSPRVLLARVRSTLRRKCVEPYEATTVISIHGIEIHPGRHEVISNGKKIELTNTEFRILHLLASKCGWVFTRNQIIEAVRSDNYPVTERSVDVVVVSIRRKLGEKGTIIETIRGVGYRCAEEG